MNEIRISPLIATRMSGVRDTEIIAAAICRLPRGLNHSEAPPPHNTFARRTMSDGDTPGQLAENIHDMTKTMLFHF